MKLAGQRDHCPPAPMKANVSTSPLFPNKEIVDKRGLLTRRCARSGIANNAGNEPNVEYWYPEEIHVIIDSGMVAPLRVWT